MKWAISNTKYQELLNKKINERKKDFATLQPKSDVNAGSLTVSDNKLRDLQIASEAEKELRLSYQHFPDNDFKQIFEDPKNPVHEWVTYKFNREIKQPAQRRYEIFCSGFLAFYDDITRSGASDHSIYFRWDKERIEKKDIYFVTIYLAPPPREATKRYSRLDPQDLVWKELAPASGRAKDPPAPPPPPPPQL